MEGTENTLALARAENLGSMVPRELERQYVTSEKLGNLWNIDSKEKIVIGKAGRNKVVEVEFGILMRMEACGMDDSEKCRVLGIGEWVYKDWKKRHSTLRKRLQGAKVRADQGVIEGLHRNATGYYYVEEAAQKMKTQKVLRVNGEDKAVAVEELQVVNVVKFRPADTLAQATWLNNKRPHQYRQYKATDSDSTNNTSVQVNVMVVGQKEATKLIAKISQKREPKIPLDTDEEMIKEATIEE